MGKNKKSKRLQQDEELKVENDEDTSLQNNSNKDSIETSSKPEREYNNKRSLNENDLDSDSEEQKKPKKKKKKVVAVEETDGTGKKNKISIRQMKKEKHAQRQADAAALAKDQLKSQCLNYLSQWKHDRQNWKFMKTKQVWLYKNKFSKQLIPESSWPLLLEYFESAQGNIRKMLLDDANKIITEMDNWTESQSNINDIENEEQSDKPDVVIYNRARSLIQCLQE